MKEEFSKNTTEVFTKTIFHYISKIQKYIGEIKYPRKSNIYNYTNNPFNNADNRAFRYMWRIQ